MKTLLKQIICIVLAALLMMQLGGMAGATEPEPAETTEPAETVEVTGPAETTEPAETVEVTEPAETTESTESEEPTEPEAPPEDEAHAAYISGMNDGSFRPEAAITRAEVAVILFRLGDYAPGESSFSDVRAGVWYAEAVNALASAGIVAGYADGSFRPKTPITRAQLAAILAKVSGETAAEAASFPDVAGHWAAEAIALAQEKGWVTGYTDGTFRPNRSVTRAEAVTMLNRFLGRNPDQEAIAGGNGLRWFPDVQPGRWYYNAVMEAATDHTAHYASVGAAEEWRDPSAQAVTVPDGFYCFQGRLYAVTGGAYVRTAGTQTLNGVRFTCQGANGVCTAATEALTLAGGELVLLQNGKPLAMPGAYADGIYLKEGHLFVAKNGYLLREAGCGTVDGVSYTCDGASGWCTVEDWTSLSLANVSLSVFSSQLTPEAGSASTETATVFDALRAAVRLYETYFRVEYPLGNDSEEAYISKALEYGILDHPKNSYTQAVRRGDVVSFLWHALRGREMTAVNSILDIPDVSRNSYYYPMLMDFYKAGIMEGFGGVHNASIYEEIPLQELGLLLTRLERPEARVRFSIPDKVVNMIQYGTSGSGQYPLTACQIGDGKNVMVLTFAIHGWEDNWNRDGQELVYLADQLKSWLEDNYDLVREGDWRVYILRCLNPDGLYLGSTCNGPGRCTTTWYNASGTLVSGRGIDMNRCFPYCFRQYSDARNFNGYSPLACAEARALASFVQSVKGSGSNLCIDTHGWYGQIITSSGKGTIYNAFKQQFPNSSYASLYGASGYFSSWAAYVQGYDSCLFELPSGITSHSSFLSAGCVWRFENVIRDLLQHY